MSDTPIPNQAPPSAPKKKRGPKPGDPRMVEFGRKGGQALAAERGPEFYREIGRKGGKTTKAKHGKAYFTEIGKKGGEAVSRTRGKEYYSSIGKLPKKGTR
jgi:general stress protein YciG